jgi:hypothetical protein
MVFRQNWNFQERRGQVSLGIIVYGQNPCIATAGEDPGKVVRDGCFPHTAFLVGYGNYDQVDSPGPLISMFLMDLRICPTAGFRQNVFVHPRICKGKAPDLYIIFGLAGVACARSPRKVQTSEHLLSFRITEYL